MGKREDIILKRKIYDKLIDWKENSTHVLELSGARQTGKTFIVNMFGEREFDRYFYINCMEPSGSELKRAIDKAFEWEPGEVRKENRLVEAFRLYSNDFLDDEKTLIVIDEIQESPEIYSKARNFHREFKARFILTGSYLSQLLEKKVFFSVGDVSLLEMETLDFEEFLMNLGEYDGYKQLDMYGKSAPEEYVKYRNFYDIYARIGGYPEVVKDYLLHQDFDKCEATLRNVIDIFITESASQFEDILDRTIFDATLEKIAAMRFRDKRESRDLAADLEKLIDNPASSRFKQKETINRVIAWLFNCHVIGYADQCLDFDNLDTRPNARFFYRDLGVAYYYLKITGEDPGAIAGLVAENFAYLSLRRRTDIAGTKPYYVYYQPTKGELDFFATSLKTHRKYGIEVKTKQNAAKTMRHALKAGLIDACYYLRLDTPGGIDADNHIFTSPLYLIDRITFED